MTQDQDHAVIWPHEMQDEHIAATVGDDDFTKFLDLDNDFHFGALENGHSGLDTPMARLAFGQNAMTSMQELGSYNDQQPVAMNMPSNEGPVGYAPQIPITDNFQAYQQHYQQMQMHHNYQVPPTPVTSEMHPAKYPHRMDNTGHIGFDTRQVSFTPLVSPAQTPLDNAFSMPEYSLADDFFSPLTSPAIEAQVNFSPSATTESPVDMSVDQLSSMKVSNAALKRGRRKGSMSQRAPARSVRQSPAMKPQTRRQASLNNIPAEKMEAILSRGQNSLSQSLAPGMPAGSDDSVSPEPLSEALMRPPPLPQMNSTSPVTHPSVQPSMSTAPVTPATLMKMPSNQAISVKSTERAKNLQNPDQMEEIILPEAAAVASRSALPEIDSRKSVEDGQGTPIQSAKSAKISAASTPRSSMTKAASQESFSKPAKIENRGGRASKKRQSTSSATISPALRPKISPSISPLVPASGPGMSHLSAETSALYLASKSNYQNILEGTHLPGVSYPENLAENLSSKRTSHKIAEQGRRNRINLALKEIEGLLPPSMTTSANKKEKTSSNENEDLEKPSLPGQGASKASTVEMAIVYIRSLQAELQVTKDRLDTVEKRLAEDNSSAGSQVSD